jgi:hypothetical protein
MDTASADSGNRDAVNAALGSLDTAKTDTSSTDTSLTDSVNADTGIKDIGATDTGNDNLTGGSLGNTSPMLQRIAFSAPLTVTTNASAENVNAGMRAMGEERAYTATIDLSKTTNTTGTGYNTTFVPNGYIDGSTYLMDRPQGRLTFTSTTGDYTYLIKQTGKPAASAGKPEIGPNYGTSM